jgi:transposase
MPKNTGRGSRSAREVAQRVTRSDEKISAWQNRGHSTGSFLEAKSRGGSFKGLKAAK